MLAGLISVDPNPNRVHCSKSLCRSHVRIVAPQRYSLALHGRSWIAATGLESVVSVHRDVGQSLTTMKRLASTRRCIQRL